MQITFPIYIQGVLTTQTMHAASNKTSKDRNHNFLHHAVNENVHIITKSQKTCKSRFSYKIHYTNTILYHYHSPYEWARLHATSQPGIRRRYWRHARMRWVMTCVFRRILRNCFQRRMTGSDDSSSRLVKFKLDQLVDRSGVIGFWRLDVYAAHFPIVWCVCAGHNS